MVDSIGEQGLHVPCPALPAPLDQTPKGVGGARFELAGATGNHPEPSTLVPLPCTG
jgi:hypothetical protein